MPTLADRLADGETVYCGWSMSGSAIAAETMAYSGFGAVCLDQQHGFSSFDDLHAGVVAVGGAGVPALIRTAFDALDDVGRVLDLGVEAVIVPMINSADQARALVDVAKFPPVGGRSWGPVRLQMIWGWQGAELLTKANQAQLVFAMIETAAALDAVEEIAGVEGIDGVFVGTNDLAVSVTGGAALTLPNAEMTAALKTIQAAAVRHGKLTGVFANSLDQARECQQLGYRLIACAVDLGLIQKGSANVLAELEQ